MLFYLITHVTFLFCILCFLLWFCFIHSITVISFPFHCPLISFNPLLQFSHFFLFYLFFFYFFLFPASHFAFIFFLFLFISRFSFSHSLLFSFNVSFLLIPFLFQFTFIIHFNEFLSFPTFISVSFKSFLTLPAIACFLT